MLFDLLLNTVKAILRILGLILPIIPTPAGLYTSFAFLAPYWRLANAFFPMDTAFTILSLSMLIELGIMAFDVAQWVWKKTPFIGK